MFGIQEILDKKLQKHLEPAKFLLRIIKGKLIELGVHLNQSQLKTLRCQLSATEPTITLELTDIQVACAKIKSRPELEKAIELLLSKIFDRAPKIAENVAHSMNLDVAEYVSELIFRRMRRTYRYALQDRRKIQACFEEDVFSIWGKSINQLEVLLGLAIESIEHLDKMFYDGNTVYSEIKWSVLSRLHGRACQITGEIICLLKAGYADGAEARWRSLHELSVVSMFISDNEDQIADLYIQHDTIEQYEDARKQISSYPELNEDSEFLAYMSEVEKKRVELIEKYGKNFGKNYGWATPALEGESPSFKEIEKHVNLSSTRYAYRQACHNIHAGVRGTFLRLGLHSESEIILAGASDYGLEKPGVCTAASLLQATVTLLHGVKIIDAAIFMKIIAKQAEVTRKEFQCAHRSILKKLEQSNID